jgi:adenosylhomocysteine nucleosidase
MDRCDVLLFVATKTELEELKRAARLRGASFDPIPVAEQEKQLPRESYWLGPIGNDRVIAVKTRMGAIGDGGSAALGLHYVQKTQATSVISLGMAFGISAKFQTFGDVLVSQSVFPYDARAIVPDGNRWRYDYEKARTYRASPITLKVLEAHRPNVTGFKVHPGCLLSGNAFIRSAAFRDDLLRWSQNVASTVVGGEMEGAGLLALAPRAHPNWTVVKGICDFAGDEQKGDAEKHRQLACSNAATFVLDALAQWKPGES